MDKETLTGSVITVWKVVSERPSTLANAKPGDTFRVYEIQVDGEDEKTLMSGGVVLDKQADDTGYPFRAKLVKPKGKRYTQFLPVAEA